MSDAVRTPSETLMSALSEVEDAEHAMIIIDHGEEGISWHCTSTRTSTKLSLVDFVRECIVDDIRNINRKED